MHCQVILFKKVTIYPEPRYNNNNDNLNTPGSRTVSSCEQYGTNLRRGLARDLGKWLTEIVSFKPALESLE